jgi:hypothetical protein
MRGGKRDEPGRVIDGVLGRRRVATNGGSENRMSITVDDAKVRIERYLKRYYRDVRDDVFDWDSFHHHLYGYIVDLSHKVGCKRGWQGHNWRQEIRKLLLSFAYNEMDKIERGQRVRRTLVKIFTFGLAE